MLIVKTPALIQRVAPGFLWRVRTQEKVLYLTFDDGPIPEITPWVLDVLREWRAKATFFCVGDNVRKHPEVLQQVLDEGHAVGNHTFHHLNGWKTPLAQYLENIEKCRAVLPSRLFRPPYGCITPAQAKQLRNQYRIVMWEVLSWDFDAKITPQKCLHNVLSCARPGSVIVMHDSLKAARNMRFALPELLRHFTEQGYRFEGLETIA